MKKDDVQEIIDLNVDNLENKQYFKEYFYYIDERTYLTNEILEEFLFLLKDTEKFTWETLCTDINNVKKAPSIILGFYQFLNKKNYNFGKYDKYIKENEYILDFKNFSRKYYFEGSNPKNIYLMDSGNRRKKMYLNIVNDNIREIIIAFLNELSSRKVFGEDIRRFVSLFEESLQEFDLPKMDINSFNHLTLDKQFLFYEKINMIPILKKFYRYLYRVREDEVFSLESGININFINRDNFKKLYSEGYRVVYLNRADEISKRDRWLLSPNGYEKYTTTMKATDFVILDFLRINTKEIREKLKSWAFYESKSLKTLKNAINNIFIYFEFVENLKNKNTIYLEDTQYRDAIIKKSEIILFLKYIKDKNYTQHTLNTYASSLASFTNYLISQGNRIDPEVLNFLRVKKPKELKGKVIEKEEFTMIFNKLIEEINIGHFQKLRYVYMYLLATTNFRPSEILDLRRNCIVETMKVGEFKIVSGPEVGEYINMFTKTSGGEAIEVNPSARTLELIKMAIEQTKDISIKASKDISEYIFLEEKANGDIQALSEDRMYRSFKRILENCNIPRDKYTIYDVRHTYMTTLFKKFDINTALIAAGHKDIKTTLGHYVHPEIQDYLEAVYKVNIGEVKVNGCVIEDAKFKCDDKDIKSITVKEGCGYCEGSCIDNDRIDCLLCRSFIVTLDREPYFKDKIKKIDCEIEHEEKNHDKEHLVSIKRLYLAYLAQIYTIKKEIFDGKR